MFNINLVTRDGASIAFDAEPTETLLDAAAREKIFLPAVCREGGCGSCRVSRETGEVQLGPYSSSALTDAIFIREVVGARSRPLCALVLRP